MGIPSVINATTPRLWDQMEGESDTAYTVFCQYLELPKRGTPEKRFPVDLSRQRGCSKANISVYMNKWNWEERAKAYDAYMLRPSAIAELEERRKFANELRKAGKTLRSKALKRITDLDDAAIARLTIEEALKILKEGINCEKEAVRAEEPIVEKKQKQLVDEIHNLLGPTTARVGNMAAGSAGAGITATERTIRFDLGGGSDAKPVCEIQDEPGALCEGSSGGNTVERTDCPWEADSSESEGGV
jgi:hypothetical protein